MPALTVLDLLALGPLLAMALGIVVALLGTAIHPHGAFPWRASLISHLIALALVLVAWPLAPREITMLVVIDALALLFMAALALTGLGLAILAETWFRARPGPRDELHLLLMLATLGAMLLAAATHFAALFLGLEILSVALFALFAYAAAPRPLEAAIKYLVLSGASSAFLLFGMALVFAETGALTLASLAAATSGSPIALAGLAMLAAGLGFKLAVVPFHMWTPDVFEGAPTPIAAAVATLSKAAVLAVSLRLLLVSDLLGHPGVVDTLFFVATLSILAGNLLALLQERVRRILAYSSIAHLGYVLVALAVAHPLGAEAVVFYTAAYLATLGTAFGALVLLESEEPVADHDRLAALRGLAWRRPLPATALTVALLSLAGIPLTAGFLAKFYVVTAGVSVAAWGALVALVVGSAIGLFYYLRVVFALYATDDAAPGQFADRRRWIATPAGALVGLLAVAVVVLGVWPTPVIDLIRVALAS